MLVMQVVYSNTVSKPLDYLQTTLLKNFSELCEDALYSALMLKGKGFLPYMAIAQGVISIFIQWTVTVRCKKGCRNIVENSGRI